MATLKVELRTLIFFSPSNAPRFVTCNLSSAKTAGTEPSELRRPCVVPLERAFPKQCQYLHAVSNVLQMFHLHVPVAGAVSPSVPASGVRCVWLA